MFLPLSPKKTRKRARDLVLLKEAELGIDHDEKDDLQDDLTEAMQRVIDYLNSFTNSDGAQLASIGWVSAAAPTKQPPGQPRVLEIINQMDAILPLDWKNPADGGRVASYRVERRERPVGAWENCQAERNYFGKSAVRQRGGIPPYRF